MANYKRKLQLQLKPKDRRMIDSLLHKGQNSVRVLKRAQILDMLDRGYSSNQIAPVLNCTPETARRTGWKYVRADIETALYEPRPGNPRLLSEKQGNQIIAMVCADPPIEYSRWTIELIAEEAIRRKIVDKVGRETIRVLLHSHDLKPWREKNVVYSGTARRRVRGKDGGHT